MRALVLVVLAACYSPRSSECEPCRGIAECPGGLACIDGVCRDDANACTAPGDGKQPDARACFGKATPPFVEICPVGAIPATRTLPATLDTNLDCTFIDNALCIVAADRLTVATRTRVTGVRPLVLLGRDELRIENSGVLDAAGHASVADFATPPGATLCTAPAGTGADTFGAGGAGGSFMTAGGTGGAGSTGGTTLSSPPSAAPMMLRPGCRGGDGGMAGTPMVAGPRGGEGGGAVYLLAPRITIHGIINASGGGARAALNPRTGGGGGGSGGMILIWSVLPIELDDVAQIFALGGGGGPGSVAQGSPGDEPDGPMAPAGATPATTGAGDGGGQEGAGLPQGGAGGGGGGGGGVGYIAIDPAVPNGEIAPPPN